MSLEIQHPRLKKLLVVFIAVFIFLILLVGVKMYQEVSPSSGPIVQQETSSPQHLTEAEIKAQLDALDEHEDGGTRLSEEEMMRQLEELEKDEDKSKRLSQEEVMKQLDALNE